MNQTAETTALVAQPNGAIRRQAGAIAAGGTGELAILTPEEFETRLQMLKTGRQRLAQVQRELLESGTDYGVIPGTNRPGLLKPGAEKLCDFYRLRASFRPEIQYGSSECSSCRMQMQEGAGKRALHPVQYLALAYGLLPELKRRLEAPLRNLVL